MTTAHRPTWKAAVGQSNEGGWTAGGAVSHQRSVLDAPAHTRLKLRAGSNSSSSKEARLQESLRLLQEAEEATKKTVAAIGKRPINPEVEEQSQLRLLKQTAEVDLEKIKKKYDDSDIEDDGGGGSSRSSSSEEESDLDAPVDSDLDSDDNDSDDDEDDEAALQAELAKIRAERDEAKRRAEAAQAAQEESQQEEAAAFGNPLLNPTTSTSSATGGRLKRRWNDDVVFRNQAKNEPAPKKRFINDTVRNDFHKRFLNKFIR